MPDETYRRHSLLASAFLILAACLICATVIRSAPKSPSGAPLQKVVDVPLPGPRCGLITKASTHPKAGSTSRT